MAKWCYLGKNKWNMEERHLMAHIKSILIEPSHELNIEQDFIVKILVEDEYLLAKTLITENSIDIITEDGNLIRTEYGYE